MRPRTFRYWLFPLACVSFLVQVGCDGGTAPPDPARMTGSPSTTIQGTVAEPVSVQVVVVDQKGKAFSGGTVNFSVVSGGGTVLPLQAVTDQAGRASATWTLGQAPGAQSLRAALASLTVQFDAEVSAGPPASVTTTSSFPGTFGAGEELSEPAVFQVEDQFGNSVPQANVTFQASDGGSADPPQALTDNDGRVATTWTLGGRLGIQTLTAAAGQAAPSSIQAEAGPGPPASISAMNSFPGTFGAGEELPEPVVFQVEDQFGNSVPQASVTFQASDGGSADPPQALTDNDGRVSTTWTLGPNNGVHTLTATVGSSVATSVEAEVYDPCQDFRTISLGDTVTGNLASTSCQDEVDGQLRLVDPYTFSVSTPRAVTFRLEPSFPNSALLLYDEKYLGGWTIPAGSLNLNAFLGFEPGQEQPASSQTESKDYRIFAGSQEAGVGEYTLFSFAVSTSMELCDPWLTTLPHSTGQNLKGSDCRLYAGAKDWYADLLVIRLNAGEGILVEQSSSEIDPRIDLFYHGGDWITYDQDGGGGNDARLEFYAPEDGYFDIYFGSDTAYDTGSYDLTVTRLVPAGPQPSSGFERRHSVLDEKLLLFIPPGFERAVPPSTVSFWWRR